MSVFPPMQYFRVRCSVSVWHIRCEPFSPHGDLDNHDLCYSATGCVRTAAKSLTISHPRGPQELALLMHQEEKVS